CLCIIFLNIELVFQNYIFECRVLCNKKIASQKEQMSNIVIVDIERSNYDEDNYYDVQTTKKGIFFMCLCLNDYS
ncbi:hypothetical protein HDU92_003863, partial [Lobulomyces angularis]